MARKYRPCPPPPKGMVKYSRHGGYSLTLIEYKTDPSKAKLRCNLMPYLLPSTVSNELRNYIPNQIIWPTPEHVRAHHMIDVILSQYVDGLVDLKAQFPDHIFGFEDYLIWLEDPTVPGSSTTRRLVKLPGTCKVERELIASRKMGDINIDSSIVRTPEDAWGELTLRKGRMILTRAYVDFSTSIVYLTHHFPGRYLALGVDQKVVTRVLGISRSELYYRRPTEEEVILTDQGVPVA